MALGIPTRGKQNNYRKHTGGGPRPDRTEQKRAEAQASQEEWRKLSPMQQLAELDRRLGKGVGAKKQRARLVAKITRAA